MEILKLTETAVVSIIPISYSIIFDSREHKKNWHVEFSGDKQAVLSDDDGRPIVFMTRQEAEKHCLARWPEIRRIDSNGTENERL